MRKLVAGLLLCALALGFIGCTQVGHIGEEARTQLDELPEPTFTSLEVYVHDLSATGIALLLDKYPNAKIPTKVVAETALAVLEEDTVTMLDVVLLSTELDGIMKGKVKIYLDLAWTLLEYNGVIRRDDLTAVLTEREQRLLVALFNGISLGAGDDETRERILDSYGPRYETGIQTRVDSLETEGN